MNPHYSLNIVMPRFLLCLFYASPCIVKHGSVCMTELIRSKRLHSDCFRILPNLVSSSGCYVQMSCPVRILPVQPITP